MPIVIPNKLDLEKQALSAYNRSNSARRRIKWWFENRHNHHNASQVMISKEIKTVREADEEWLKIGFLIKEITGN